MILKSLTIYIRFQCTIYNLLFISGGLQFGANIASLQGGLGSQTGEQCSQFRSSFP